jgi:hypothetical protein
VVGPLTKAGVGELNSPRQPGWRAGTHLASLNTVIQAGFCLKPASLSLIPEFNQEVNRYGYE